MPPPADRLYTVASLCLSVIEDHYAEKGADLPTRRCVTDGVAIYDCEQLTVQVERVYSITGNAAQESLAEADCLGMRAATLAITTLRCVPTLTSQGKAPTTAKLDASAQRLLADPTLQWNALRQARKAGALAPYNHGLVLENWQGIGPEGGLGGGTMRVRWTLTAGPVAGS